MEESEADIGDSRAREVGEEVVPEAEIVPEAEVKSGVIASQRGRACQEKEVTERCMWKRKARKA